MPIPIQARTALWDQVWDEYDLRQDRGPALATTLAPTLAPTLLPTLGHTPKAMPAARRGRGAAWGRRLRGMAALCIVLGATAFATAPIVAAARVGQALASGDVAQLQMAVDWQSLSPALRHGMDAAIQGNGLGSGSSGGSGGGAATFLAGMADEMMQGLATPAGLMALVRPRLPAEGGLGGMGMIGAIRPVGGGRWQVALHAPGESREALTVTLALRDALTMHWQVVGLDVPRLLAEWES